MKWFLILISYISYIFIKVLKLNYILFFIIKFKKRLIFEVANLKNATPATVSRGGVLFINDTDIGWMPYFNSWVDRSKE